MDIWPRPGINICQNQVRTLAILGATAAQTRQVMSNEIDVIPMAVFEEMMSVCRLTVAGVELALGVPST